MANEFEIIGTVTKVGDVETFGTNGFRKRAIVIRTREHDKWPEHVQVEAQGDTVDLVPSLGKITVRGWITGRMAQDGRVWNTLKVRDWTQDKQIAAPPVRDPVHQAFASAQVPAGNAADDDQGLPF
jgi:hypothetical protein